jgi:hypothetical protein
MEPVEVWWVGLECRQRQESVDEVFGTVNLVSEDGQHKESVKFPEGADYWELGPDGQRIVSTQTLLYRGPAKDIALAASLVEYDSGDIQQYKDGAAQAVSSVATAAIGSATGGAGTVAKPLVDLLAKALVDLTTAVLGTDSDTYAPRGIRLPAQAMAPAAQRRRTLRRTDDARHIDWTDVIVLIGVDDGGDVGEYAVYFDVRGPGWGEPYSMAPPGSALTGPLAAASQHREHMDLFWVAPDGAVMAKSWAGAGWSEPYLLVPADVAHARGVVAASRFDQHMDVFWSNADGGIGAKSWMR